MKEAYYAGVYWSARQESAESCARRAQVFFKTLAASDEFFADWFIPPRSRKQAPRPLDLELATLQELFEQTRTRNDEGGVIEDLGFGLSADNGMRPGKQQGDHASVEVLCGCSAAPVSNLCLLHLPSTGPHLERMLTVPMLTAILRAMVVAWDPDSGVVNSNAYALRNKALPAHPSAGWMIYLSRRLGPLPPLPAPVRVEPVDDRGALLILTPDHFTVENAEHVALADDIQALLNRMD
ncbi:Imm52 family immunity protein [Hyalangium gracile]|uniref:Imm52 family immunity protein n=1 Tax=Hyalangium gracile TaxID=394092 RepID=UPI001CC9C408|nr:Imm52 family immunity protein [Hyalangium gracile]